MIQVIDYKENENSILVGFKKYIFVVYGQLGIIEGYTKEQHLQVLYEQCKPALDYETERYNQGKSNSIMLDEEGEEFIPELPKVKSLKLLLGKDYVQFEEGQESDTIYLSTVTKDQYNENINVDVGFTTSLGEINGSELIIPSVEEFIEVIVTATIGNVSDSELIEVYPYEEPQPDKVDVLDNRVMDVEQAIDIMLGGEVIE